MGKRYQQERPFNLSMKIRHSCKLDSKQGKKSVLPSSSFCFQRHYLDEKGKKRFKGALTLRQRKTQPVQQTQEEAETQTLPGKERRAYRAPSQRGKMESFHDQSKWISILCLKNSMNSRCVLASLYKCACPSVGPSVGLPPRKAFFDLDKTRAFCKFLSPKITWKIHSWEWGQFATLLSLSFNQSVFSRVHATL